MNRIGWEIQSCVAKSGDRVSVQSKAFDSQSEALGWASDLFWNLETAEPGVIGFQLRGWG
jgi:hypothetical protein